jgi:hypothetical protein
VLLRHLRVHSLVLAADPTDARREVVRADLNRVETELATLRRVAVNPGDSSLVDIIERDYAAYKARLTSVR